MLKKILWQTKNFKTRGKNCFMYENIHNIELEAMCFILAPLELNIAWRREKRDIYKLKDIFSRMRNEGKLYLIL